MRIAEMNRLAIVACIPLTGSQTDDPFHQLRASGADQTGKAEYLAPVEMEARILHVAGYAEVIDFENGSVVMLACAVRIKL